MQKHRCWLATLRLYHLCMQPATSKSVRVTTALFADLEFSFQMFPHASVLFLFWLCLLFELISTDGYSWLFSNLSNLCFLFLKTTCLPLQHEGKSMHMKRNELFLAEYCHYHDLDLLANKDVSWAATIKCEGSQVLGVTFELPLDLTSVRHPVIAVSFLAHSLENPIFPIKRTMKCIQEKGYYASTTSLLKSDKLRQSRTHSFQVTSACASI